MKERLRDEYDILLANIVKKIVADTHIKASPMEDGYVLDVPVEQDRFGRGRVEGRDMRWQRVFITRIRRSKKSEDIYKMATVCAPDDERFYRLALVLNMCLSMGAFALSNKKSEKKGEDFETYSYPEASTAPADIENLSDFVMVEKILARDASVNKIKESLTTLATVGDGCEKMLVGVDIA